MLGASGQSAVATACSLASLRRFSGYCRSRRRVANEKGDAQREETGERAEVKRILQPIDEGALHPATTLDRAGRPCSAGTAARTWSKRLSRNRLDDLPLKCWIDAE